MLHRNLFLVATLLLALLGTVSAAEAGRIRRFHDHGVVFAHPADWKVSTEDTEGGPIVTVEGPEESIAMVSIFKEGVDVTLEEYTSTCLKNIESSLPPEAKFKRIAQSVRAGVVDVKYVLTYEGTDMPATVNLSKHTLGGRVVFCVTQAADEDRKTVQAGFDQIRRTLAAAKK